MSYISTADAIKDLDDMDGKDQKYLLKQQSSIQIKYKLFHELTIK